MSSDREHTKENSMKRGDTGTFCGRFCMVINTRGKRNPEVKIQTTDIHDAPVQMWVYAEQVKVTQ